MPSRASNALLMVVSRADRDIGISLTRRFARLLSGFEGGESRTHTRHGRACPGHPRLKVSKEDVDARHKAGHDAELLDYRQPLQKSRQIIGDMIDMGRVAALQLP